MEPIIEKPVIEIDNIDGEKFFRLKNYINIRGQMVVDKNEAYLLFLELRKFLTEE